MVQVARSVRVQFCYAFSQLLKNIAMLTHITQFCGVHGCAPVSFARRNFTAMDGDGANYFLLSPNVESVLTGESQMPVFSVATILVFAHICTNDTVQSAGCKRRVWEDE